jgi:hypothetical protein
MAKGGAARLPLLILSFVWPIAAVIQNDDGDGACYAGGGADRAKKLHWMIVPGHCWPSKNEPIALAGWLHAQRPEESVL